MSHLYLTCILICGIVQRIIHLANAYGNFSKEFWCFGIPFCQPDFHWSVQYKICIFVGSTLNVSASRLFTFAMYGSTEKEDNKRKVYLSNSFS